MFLPSCDHAYAANDPGAESKCVNCTSLPPLRGIMNRFWTPGVVGRNRPQSGRLQEREPSTCSSVEATSGVNSLAGVRDDISHRLSQSIKTVVVNSVSRNQRRICTKQATPHPSMVFAKSCKISFVGRGV